MKNMIDVYVHKEIILEQGTTREIQKEVYTVCEVAEILEKAEACASENAQAAGSCDKDIATSSNPIVNNLNTRLGSSLQDPDPSSVDSASMVFSTDHQTETNQSEINSISDVWSIAPSYLASDTAASEFDYQVRMPNNGFYTNLPSNGSGIYYPQTNLTSPMASGQLQYSTLGNMDNSGIQREVEPFQGVYFNTIRSNGHAFQASTSGTEPVSRLDCPTGGSSYYQHGASGATYSQTPVDYVQCSPLHFNINQPRAISINNDSIQPKPTPTKVYWVEVRRNRDANLDNNEPRGHKTFSCSQPSQIQGVFTQWLKSTFTDPPFDWTKFELQSASTAPGKNPEVARCEDDVREDLEFDAHRDGTVKYVLVPKQVTQVPLGQVLCTGSGGAIRDEVAGGRREFKRKPVQPRRLSRSCLQPSVIPESVNPQLNPG